jgi:hypothetical protein
MFLGLYTTYVKQRCVCECVFRVTNVWTIYATRRDNWWVLCCISEEDGWLTTDLSAIIGVNG